MKFDGYITEESLAELRADGRAWRALIAAERVLVTSARVLQDPFMVFQPKRRARILEHRRKIMADIAVLNERPSLPAVPDWIAPQYYWSQR